ncbi:glycine/sarcosine/betaine reductase selenoprotein B family protein [Tengunoibacter tsumagoiensis]|uniref:D-proline reductase (Dithiol) protein PrdB n=1 Tax=Tengunoibacter tsumagoiensis TaxID=2014871 RepID=A0A402A1A2_9CHLR|nr:glycine/sarcosine/betaine reductase selenoprotein B family protein [Tengunoibacter tsumagoiensis]GCE12832.1 D-proline reductase (dithiol) protein PrdB [Tengunoibacter tsumagoiensis]
MAMSKRCIPYTPRNREVKESTFALITTAGVHLREQEPFNTDGDNSWRLIPGDVQSEQLMVTHEHYDHRDADQDINCIFPIDRLRELAAEGIIAGVSDKHLGFMGFSQNFRDLYERAAPEMAKIIVRSKADGVILTAGCPLCHRVVCYIAREVESAGIPTVIITVAPEHSRPAGPPRAIAPEHFKLGNSLGGPGQHDLQRKVLLDALRRWETREEPGHIWEIAYPEYDSSDWQPIVLTEG